MNLTTIDKLERCDEKTRLLYIDNDASLTVEDASKIGIVLRKHPRLDKFCIVNCGLTAAHLDRLLPDFANHPSLTGLNFDDNPALSIKVQADFIERLLTTNKRIHTLVFDQVYMDFADNPIAFLQYSIRRLPVMSMPERRLAAFLADHDTLVAYQSMALSTMRPYIKFSEDLEARRGDGAIRNLFSEQYIVSMEGPFPDVRTKCLNRCINSKTTNDVFLHVLNRQALARSNAAFISDRLPAALFMAENRKSYYERCCEKRNRNMGWTLYDEAAARLEQRVAFVKNLVKLDEQLRAEAGVGLDLAPYLTLNDKIALGDAAAALAAGVPSAALPSLEITLPKVVQPTVVAAVAPPALDDIVQALGTTSEATWRAALAEARTDTQKLFSLGAALTEAVVKLPGVSLAAAIDTPMLDTPIRSMATFLASFEQAKAKLATYAAAVGLGDAKEDKADGFLKRFLALGGSKPTSPSEALTILAEAGEKARCAGLALQELLPSLGGMEGQLTQQMLTTQELTKAYQLVAREIGTLTRVGGEVLASWRAEAGEDESFPLRLLATRLDGLASSSSMADMHVARHKAQNVIEQEQYIGVVALRTENVPLMTEQVAAFIKQVVSLHRAGMMKGIADATRMAADDNAQIGVLTALETVRAIEGLSVSMQQAMERLGKNDVKALETPLRARQLSLDPGPS
jgi:hypothetical protein